MSSLTVSQMVTEEEHEIEAEKKMNSPSLLCERAITNDYPIIFYPLFSFFQAHIVFCKINFNSPASV